MTLPHSAAVVLEVLQQGEVLSGRALQTKTGLCKRTTYSATRRLIEMGLIRRIPSLRDARLAYYVHLSMSTNASTHNKIQPTSTANSNGAVRMSSAAMATRESVPDSVSGPSDRAMREQALRAQFFPSKAASHQGVTA